MDFRMPFANGFEIMAQIRRCFPATRVMAITGYDSRSCAKPRWKAALWPSFPNCM
jgi:DNA-binding NarL/FixJ family response regulator